ncbi:ADP-ribosylglycohydrolase family protein [Microbispora sp. H11081]|uniref:ADP-ribosylglycohydrolase family protein n=1 Tax=Microbispora sp. H11081 TaxID=2729107 RepID=UPI00147421C7|nr:ADP-ribosylglycohydrolase family protein [Microbispora sp. H11081]
MISKKTVSSNFTDKVEGAILGAAVGDALGWPQEQRSGIIGGKSAKSVPPRPIFREWTRLSGSRFNRYEDVVRPGEYSDDTQLLLSVARACFTDEWVEYFSRVELPAWPAYQRGGGRAVLNAARHWGSFDAPPWYVPTRSGAGSEEQTSDYFSRGANGVAMRIAPHAIVTADMDSPGPLVSRVLTDGIHTHGHPRALMGGLIHALSLRYAFRLNGTLGYSDLLSFLYADSTWQDPEVLEGLPAEWRSAYQSVTHKSPEAAWRQTADETRGLLEIALLALERGAAVDDETTLGRLGCFDKKQNGAGHVTAVASSYIASRTATRPLSGLLLSAFLPDADTDTLASMTASLLGAVQGAEWLSPLAEQVQDSNYLRRISRTLAAQTLGAIRDNELLPKRSMGGSIRRESVRFRDELERSNSHTTVTFIDGRQMRLEEREILVSHSQSSRVFRWRLRANDGQSIVVDRIHRAGSDSFRRIDSRFAPTGSEYKQQELFPEPYLDDSLYDAANFTTLEEATSALVVAQREISIREEFGRLQVLATTSPRQAVVASRRTMERILEAAEHSRSGLDADLRARARDVWRLAASVAHDGDHLSIEAAVKYVQATERVAIQVARSMA